MVSGTQFGAPWIFFQLQILLLIHMKMHMKQIHIIDKAIMKCQMKRRSWNRRNDHVDQNSAPIWIWCVHSSYNSSYHVHAVHIMFKTSSQSYNEIESNPIKKIELSPVIPVFHFLEIAIVMILRRYVHGMIIQVIPSDLISKFPIKLIKSSI